MWSLRSFKVVVGDLSCGAEMPRIDSPGRHLTVQVRHSQTGSSNPSTISSGFSATLGPAHRSAPAIVVLARLGHGDDQRALELSDLEKLYGPNDFLPVRKLYLASGRQPEDIELDFVGYWPKCMRGMAPWGPETRRIFCIPSAVQDALIVSQVRFLRESLVEIVARAPGIRTCRQAGTLSEAFASAVTWPGILLLDAALPGRHRVGDEIVLRSPRGNGDCARSSRNRGERPGLGRGRGRRLCSEHCVGR